MACVRCRGGGRNGQPPGTGVLLCDANGPFWRHFTPASDGCSASFCDHTVEGDPYTPVGDIGACAGDITGPITVEGCTPITATGLCLADGTPIAVIISRDCDSDATTEDGWVDLLTGLFAAGPPPADATACAGGGPAVDSELEPLCDADGVAFLRRYTIDAGTVTTTDTTLDGTTPFTPADPVGVCGPTGDGESPGESCAGVAAVTLCDVTDDACTRFLRHLVHDCDGNVIASTDTTVDGQPYTVAGEAVDCADCPCPDQTKVLVLCDVQPDGTVVQFLRWITYNADGVVTEQRDTTLDGTTEYMPTGGVGTCDDGDGSDTCLPVPMCPRLAAVVGPGAWIMPPGTESLSVSVVAGPVTVTDCDGVETVLAEGCGTLSWSAPSLGCTSGVMCGSFTVDAPEGSTAYVNWLEPCGGESP